VTPCSRKYFAFWLTQSSVTFVEFALNYIEIHEDLHYRREIERRPICIPRATNLSRFRVFDEKHTMKARLRVAEVL